MSIRPKPKKVDDFISLGGADSQEPPITAKKQIQSLKLRINLDLLREIDAAVAARRPSPSRHQWLLEAIYEKLNRESN